MTKLSNPEISLISPTLCDKNYIQILQLLFSLQQIIEKVNSSILLLHIFWVIKSVSS
jgi:hypothetical protein